MAQARDETDGGVSLDRRLQAAFHAHRLSGLRLAAHVRAGAAVAITVWLFLLLERGGWFYVPILALFVASGYAHFAIARHHEGRTWQGYAFFAFDAVLVTIAVVAPNPLLADIFPWPPQMALRYANFNYYYILIALLALTSYTPRVMLFGGLACVLAWAGGVAWIASLPGSFTGIPSFDDPVERLERFLDPYFVSLDIRITEALVMLIVVAALAAAVARGRRLIRDQVVAARERANLSRHFPPGIVDELAGHDDPFGEVRRQDVAVLFADIVGFTHMVETVPPEDVVDMLRAFHARLERTVFEHGGTLDKYLGDGVMATFGTPRAGPRDAVNALACARALVDEIAEWNARRRAAGYPEVQLSVGAHRGPVVLGDVGTARRLEFTVLGDTVNVAGRLEEATRRDDCAIVVSDALVAAAKAEDAAETGRLLASFVAVPGLVLRGRDRPIDVWTFRDGG